MNRVIRAFELAITVGVALAACKAPPDPERDVRDRYVETQVKAHDAGPMWLLASTTPLTFGRGFYGIEAATDASDCWRWAAKDSEIRVRAKTDGPIRLRLRGRGGRIEIPNQLITVTVDGETRVRFDPGDEFSVDVTVVESAKADAMYSVELHAANAFVRPNDSRELAFSLISVTWL